MLFYKSITAWIESEGVRLPQYKAAEKWDDDRTNFPTISCWIPSELGQKFEVCFTDDDLEASICGYIEIDGQRCGSKFLRAPIDRGKVMRRDSVRTSETEVGYFQFADVVTTDDDEYEGQDMNSMGAIEVVLKRVQISPRFNGNPRVRTSFPSTGRRVVHEKDKKGLMHTVRLAPSYAASTGPHRSKLPLSVVPYDPIVKFVFRYAPLNKLRADGIAPPLVEVKTEPELKQEEVIECIDLTEDDPPIVRKEIIFIDFTLDSPSARQKSERPETDIISIDVDEEIDSEEDILEIIQ
ncbi:hypothetical protein L218DRAFT_620879 [Marasmius fiardii PR-910]|nr:hypothetical protein L218DRAFT_620879 [Marasmius fiardii PR-910]